MIQSQSLQKLWGHLERENSGSSIWRIRSMCSSTLRRKEGSSYHSFYVLEYSCGLLFLIFIISSCSPLGLSFTSWKTTLWCHPPAYRLLQGPLHRAASAPFPRPWWSPHLPSPVALFSVFVPPFRNWPRYLAGEAVCTGGALVTQCAERRCFGVRSLCYTSQTVKKVLWGILCLQDFPARCIFHCFRNNLKAFPWTLEPTNDRPLPTGPNSGMQGPN